jgi:hypothetical protein
VPAIIVSTVQLAQQVSVAAGCGLELEHGVIDPKGLQEIAPNLFGQRLSSADRLIGHHHMAGKRDAVR